MSIFSKIYSNRFSRYAEIEPWISAFRILVLYSYNINRIFLYLQPFHIIVSTPLWFEVFAPATRQLRSLINPYVPEPRFTTVTEYPSFVCSFMARYMVFDGSFGLLGHAKNMFPCCIMIDCWKAGRCSIEILCDIQVYVNYKEYSILFHVRHSRQYKFYSFRIAICLVKLENFIISWSFFFLWTILRCYFCSKDV